MRLTSSTRVYRTAAAILALVGMLCEAQTARDTKIDVGGFKLYFSEAGSGTPVVVFESGLGEDVATWGDVQPQVAQFTHTFVYDRAGLGKSDPSPRPRTVPELASELHALLKAARVPPPFVLVGHSLGGAIVQVFAHEYPKEVAALVLLDPEDGRLNERLRAGMTPPEWAAREKAMADVMPKFSAAQTAELDQAYKASGKDVADALPLPSVPVVLFSGTKKNPEFPGNPLEQDLKVELHNELMANLPQGRHLLVPNSRHYIQNDAPDLVIEAIRGVVVQASMGQGLSRP